jgi:hypothetical protein
MKVTRTFLAHLCAIALGFLLLAGASLSTAVLAAQQANLKTSGAYDFPVKPGTPEWAALKSHDEMLKISQIPTEVLQRMTTRELVKTVLDYPLFGDMLAHNILQEGFGRVTEGFNGLKELIQRSDAGAALLARYRRMNPAGIRQDWTLEQRGNFDRSFTYIETLLAQDAIIAGMTKGERREVIAEALMKGQLKGQFPEIYGQFGRERVALIMGRILRRENFDSVNESARSNSDLEVFLRDGTDTTEEVISEITTHAQRFISVGLIEGKAVRPVSFTTFGQTLPGRLTLTDDHYGDALFRKASLTPSLVARDYNSSVYTPRGSAVPVIVRTYEHSPAQIASWSNYVATTYPQATRETDASRRYNCHSYAWHSNSIYNDKWMNDPGDNTYWNDGSYIGSYAVGAANRKVSYVYGDHSAITIDGIYFRSKWGEGPRMRHAYNYSPYNSSVLNYYQQN